MVDAVVQKGKTAAYTVACSHKLPVATGASMVPDFVVVANNSVVEGVPAEAPEET